MTAVSDPRPLMVEIADLLYRRHLTNSAGGNISCRVGERIYITPRRLGSRHRWRLREDMVLVFGPGRTAIEGDPAAVSREAGMHFACYEQLPEVGGLIHAHARYLSVFAAAGEPVVPTNDYTEKYGTVGVIPPYPSHSPALARAVVERVREQREALTRHGLGLILAWHGAVTVGRDLADAYDTLDRLESSAHTLLMLRAAGMSMLDGRGA